MDKQAKVELDRKNKLIAEFLGWEFGGTYWYNKSGLSKGTVLHFNNSWDWLMRAVDTIENDHAYKVYMENQKCSIRPHTLYRTDASQITIYSETRLKACFEAVAMFVEQQQAYHSSEQVAEAMVNNPSRYKENLKILVTKALEQDYDTKQYWLNWFNGKSCNK